MWLHIDPRANEPIYLQIVQGIKGATAKGVLAPGEKLPSVRELATEFAVNHNTVAKAYQELERDNVIEVIRGRGTFISIEPSPTNREERLKDMRMSLSTWFVEAIHLGLTEEDFINLVRDIIHEWNLDREMSE